MYRKDLYWFGNATDAVSLIGKIVKVSDDPADLIRGKGENAILDFIDSDCTAQRFATHPPGEQTDLLSDDFFAFLMEREDIPSTYRPFDSPLEFLMYGSSFGYPKDDIDGWGVFIYATPGDNSFYVRNDKTKEHTVVTTQDLFDSYVTTDGEPMGMKVSPVDAVSRHRNRVSVPRAGVRESGRTEESEAQPEG